MTIQNKNLNKPLDKNELEELNTALGSAGFSISYLHGLFCAVISAPTFLMPSSWQQPLYNEIEFESAEQAGKIISLVLRFYNEVSKQLENDHFKPFLYRNQYNQLEDLEIAEDWSEGYLDGVDIDPMWSKLEEEDEQMEFMLLPFIWVAGYGSLEEDGEILLSDSKIKEYKQMMFSKLEETTRFFYETWSKARQKHLQIGRNDVAPLFSGEKDQGRNELCACGSGKKYKKCCLNVKVLH